MRPQHFGSQARSNRQGDGDVPAYGRLDLDDYNAEAYQGLHITSMAGTWMSIVEGFGGFRMRNDMPEFNAVLPSQWHAFSFKLRFRNRTLQVRVDGEGTTVKAIQGDPLEVMVDGRKQQA